MTQTADRLARILATTPLRLADVSEAEASHSSAPGHWSKKQVLGHLIDSASNNHQRFVRAQLAASYEGPSYEQEGWVNTQSYATENWPDLVNLWLLYNRHLLHIIRNVNQAALPVPFVANAQFEFSLAVLGHARHGRQFHADSRQTFAGAHGIGQYHRQQSADAHQGNAGRRWRHRANQCERQHHHRHPEQQPETGNDHRLEFKF